MRGFALGGANNRIRMDFADVENMPPPRGYQGSDYDPNIARNADRSVTSHVPRSPSNASA